MVGIRISKKEKMKKIRELINELDDDLQKLGTGINTENFDDMHFFYDLAYNHLQELKYLLEGIIK
jgi:hypothetical protein